MFAGHYLLRAKVAVLQETVVDDGNPVIKNELASYIQILRKSCSLLGDHLKMKREPPWNKIAAYYAESDLSLSDLVERLVPVCMQNQLGVWMDPSKEDLVAGKAALAVFRTVMFDKKHVVRVNDTAQLANIILNVYWLTEMEELSSVILDSQLSKYTPEFAVNLLKDIATRTKVAKATSSSTDSQEADVASQQHEFALGLLYLRIGDIQTALKRLSQISVFLKQSCAEKPGLLVAEELDDPLYPDVCGSQAGLQAHKKLTTHKKLRPTRLGSFLGDHAPSILKDVLQGSGNNISVASGLRLLIPSDTGRSAVYEHVVHYLTKSLDTTDANRRTTCVTFLAMILLQQLVALCKQGDGAAHRVADLTDMATDLQFKRPSWLGHIPPFDEQTLSIPHLAAKKLLLLQGLIFQYLTVENATALYTIIIKSHAENYPGRLSLELLCLPTMGRVDEGQRMLLRVYPSALLGYSCAFLPSNKSTRWEKLLWKLLALVECSQSEFDDVAEPANQKGRFTFTSAYSCVRVGVCLLLFSVSKYTWVRSMGAVV